MPPFAMHLNRRKLLAAIAFVVVVPTVWYFFILDWRDQPFCHKQLLLGFENWLDKNKTNVFPNVDGKSAESLEAARDELGGDDNWETTYKYVPGLKKGDPGDLVLAYLAKPTRWTWHGQIPPTVFTAKEWLFVPVDFGIASSRPVAWGECSERVPSEDFQKRMKRTLDFLRTNERPNWEAVVKEHANF
jgi:hypothetical protein